MYTNWKLPENERRLSEAVANSTSIAGVCRILGLAPKGGNYRTLRHQIARLDLDVSHHTGQAWNKDNYQAPSSSHTKRTIRERLIRESGHQCWACGLGEWMGRPIPLEMDHIDGNNDNNVIDNLRILCSNCHAQTPTFRNRRRGDLPPEVYRKTKEIIPDNYCECGTKVLRKSTRCVECDYKERPARGRAAQRTKIDWPSYDELIDRLARSNYTRLAAELKVTDNAIRKHLKNNPK